MLKYSKSSNNIKKFIQQNTVYEDRSILSENYFRLYDLDDTMKLGKNSFRINANIHTLVQGSNVYVDITDTNGNPIYFEFVDLKLEDRSACCSIHIYEDTPTGIAQLIIAGRANNLNGVNIKSTSDQLDIPNVYYSHNINIISSVPTDDEILYKTPPTVSIGIVNTEIKPLENPGNRRVIIDETSGGILNITRTRGVYNTPDIIVQTVIEEDVVTTYNLTDEQMLLQSSSPIFIPQMEGGFLHISNLPILIGNTLSEPDKIILAEYLLLYPNTIPNEINVPIVRIVDSTHCVINYFINIDISFNGLELNINEIANITDWEISYNSTELDLAESYEKSFVNISFKNLQPASGNISHTEIYYKLYENPGDFQYLGKYSLFRPQNILINNNLVPGQQGFIPESNWIFNTLLNTSPYWNINDLDITTSTKYIGCYTMIPTGPQPELRLVNTKFKSNTRYQFNCETFREGTTGEVNIYISNNKFEVDRKKYIDNSSIEKIDGFTHIGHINHQYEAVVNSEINFKCLEDIECIILIKFSGTSLITFKKFELIVSNDPGFGPDIYNLYFPLELFTLNKELIFKIKYLNDYNEYARHESILDGLIFNGSYPLSLISIDELIGYPELDDRISDIETDIITLTSDIDNIDTNIDTIYNEIDLINNKPIPVFKTEKIIKNNFTGNKITIKRKNVENVNVFVSGLIFNDYKLINSNIYFNYKLINSNITIIYS